QGEKALEELWQAFHSGGETEEQNTPSELEAENMEDVLFLFRRAEDDSDEKLKKMEIFMRSGTQSKLNRYVPNSEDPCRVFIGLRLSDIYRIEPGVKVQHIIEDTPAAEAELQSGDIILEMDGVSVHNTGELIKQRNTHEPGDRFWLKVQRGDEVRKVKARFKPCEQEETEVPDEAPAVEPVEKQAIQQLELEQYRAFPNPSFGRIQLQFEAAPVPTTVQLTDASGKVVYVEQLNSFNGTYNRAISLQDAAPGTIVVSVRQGDQVVSRKVLLLNRA
ncbi:MAG TPA: PDZ domain-containing protein, partial [Phaeodactylibacter sp.]|nr:PDZ domain-containing protein [Phaeodactylibacter sp.]